MAQDGVGQIVLGLGCYGKDESERCCVAVCIRAVRGGHGTPVSRCASERRPLRSGTQDREEVVVVQALLTYGHHRKQRLTCDVM